MNFLDLIVLCEVKYFLLRSQIQRKCVVSWSQKIFPADEYKVNRWGVSISLCRGSRADLFFLWCCSSVDRFIMLDNWPDSPYINLADVVADW